MSAFRIDTVLAAATHQLHASPTPRLDAELLLSHTLNKPRSYLFTWPETLLNTAQREQFQQLITQRQKGVPIAYLTHERAFWNLQLKVTHATLIPRPDTERLVELALSQTLPERAAVADLGTGTGAIALALAKERPKWSLTAIDKSPDALTVAKENARYNDIDNVTFLQGSWCEPLANTTVDMIVSNPPYIRDDDPHLHSGDVRHEPRSALASGADGLQDIRLIASTAQPILKPGAWLLLEHGFDQGEEVQAILSHCGYQHVCTEVDLAGQDRVTLAQKPK